MSPVIIALSCTKLSSIYQFINFLKELVYKNDGDDYRRAYIIQTMQ